jgi:hypothetical protein
MSETDEATRARYLLQHIVDQVDKRQYLNAACVASELTTELMMLFGKVKREQSKRGPAR